MASHVNSSGSVATANVVGNAFVSQYYQILHHTPGVVHRFYTEASHVSRAEAGADGVVDTLASPKEIQDKVMSLGFGDVKAEIFSVDSQDSFNGGVLVTVTGLLSNTKLNTKRTFVQSFFLAPQEKGYFVLNDIFRYIDAEPYVSKQAVIHANGVPEATPILSTVEQEPIHVAEQHDDHNEGSPPTSEVEVDEIFDMPETHVEVSEAEEDGGVEEMTRVETTPVIDEPPSPLAEPAAVPPVPEEIPGEAPKKSYASILRHQIAGGVPQSPSYGVTPKPAASPAHERPAVSPAHQAIPAAVQSGSDNLDEGLPVEIEVDGRSVYVKNLPITVTALQIEEEFSKFGTIKEGGVNVRNKGVSVCYAFVEFEDAASASSAIESSPITLGGRQVYIEEKRQMGSRGSRGRAPIGGRGDRPFRGESLRGRGDRGFPGGRSASLGGRGMGQERDTSNRGFGSGPVRGGSGNHGGMSSNGGLGGSVIGAENYRQGGNGNRPPRRGGNQMPRNGSFSRGSTPVAATT